MKVIFLEDVSNMGRAGETKEVAEGYGRNYLIPQKLAVLADSKASNIVAAQLKKLAHRKLMFESEMKEVAARLEGKEYILKARAGSKDRLYGSITNADIAEELSNSSGYEIDKKKIDIEDAIHQLGSYEVAVRLAKDIVPIIKLTVVADEEEKKEEKPEKENEKKKVKLEKAKKDEVKSEKAGEEEKGEVKPEEEENKELEPGKEEEENEGEK
ncbi:50S ribosomal protein L9 [Chloroflexota bacterium]